MTVSSNKNRKPGQQDNFVISSLLSSEENSLVYAMLGPRCQSLVATVAQVYCSEGPGHSYRWNKRCTGVVSFVKDNVKRSYYIRVYDIDQSLLVFEQEIYQQFKYKNPRPYFHTFEGDDSQIGLNFADEREASLFQDVIEAKLRERKERREKRHQAKRNVSTANFTNGSRPTNGINKPNNPPIPNFNQNAHMNTTNKANAPKSEKRKLKKEDIGLPTNFQHISHVGWDPNRGFDLENVDPNLKKFFQKAGVDERILQNKDTREFIYDFIDKHGGVEAALREVNNITENVAPPPPPRILTASSNVSSSPNRSNLPSQHPPPPPSLQNVGRSNSMRAAPPAPPTAKSSNSAPPPPPPPPPTATNSSAPIPPPPPPTTTAPPPPPLPDNRATPVPPPPPALPPVQDARVNLMEAIRQGAGTLRHVSPEKTARPSVDTRGELMDQIRQGVSLKKVDVSQSCESGGSPGTSESGIAGMLQRALQERGMVMGQSSSEDEGDDDEDEWD